MVAWVECLAQTEQDQDFVLMKSLQPTHVKIRNKMLKFMKIRMHGKVNIKIRKAHK